MSIIPININELPTYHNPLVPDGNRVPSSIWCPQVSTENVVVTALTTKRLDLPTVHAATINTCSVLIHLRLRVCMTSGSNGKVALSVFRKSIVGTGARQIEDAVSELMHLQVALLSYDPLRYESDSVRYLHQGRQTALELEKNKPSRTVDAAPKARLLDDDGNKLVEDDAADEDNAMEFDADDDEPSKYIDAKDLSIPIEDRVRNEMESLPAALRPSEASVRYDGYTPDRPSSFGRIGFLCNIAVQNVVGTVRTGMTVDLPTLADKVVPEISSFKPKRFPGVIVKEVKEKKHRSFMYDPRVETPEKFIKPVITIFTSGSAIITGKKTMHEMYQVACYAVYLIWRTKKITDTNRESQIAQLMSNNVTIDDYAPLAEIVKNNRRIDAIPQDARQLGYSRRTQDTVNQFAVSDGIQVMCTLMKGMSVAPNRPHTPRPSPSPPIVDDFDLRRSGSLNSSPLSSSSSLSPVTSIKANTRRLSSSTSSLPTIKLSALGSSGSRSGSSGSSPLKRSSDQVMASDSKRQGGTMSSSSLRMESEVLMESGSVV